MDQESEMGRFKPRKKPDEPHEPFLPDEQFEPTHEGKPPMVSQLHIPSEPLTKEKLKTFLLELSPLIEQEERLSQKDEKKLNEKLTKVDDLLRLSDLSDEIKNTFSQIVQKCVHTMSLHFEPKEKKELIAQLEALLFKL